MDSMRSLNSSLPSSTPLTSRPQSQDQLLQAFKSAALSVTNLYKSAASSQSDARKQGYQDALKDILLFLDRENLGLMDGEGWKVRQWATERYSGGVFGTNIDDSEEEIDAEEEVRARSSSPSRPPGRERHQPSRTSSPMRKEASPTRSAIASATVLACSHQQQQQRHNTDPQMFTFTAAPPAGMDTDALAEQSTEASNAEPTAALRLSDASIRLEAHPRGARTAHRHGRDRNTQRSGARDLRLNTASKRKFTVPDFFDLSNLENGNGNGREGSGGGSSKKGRFV